MTIENTPGPWFLDKSGKIWRRPPSELYERGGGTAGDHPVAQAFRGHSSWEQGFPVEANGRLIAAAPELLQALQKLLDLRVAKEELEYLDRGIGTKTPNAAWLEARAAIAKAKGEQQ